MSMFARFHHALAAAVVAATSSTAAVAFPDPTELLNDFTHYALIANVELASASAQSLLDSGVTNADLAVILDEGKVSGERFDRAVARAMMIPELENYASELAKRVEDGRLDLSRDPKRIDEAVDMLIGTQRARLLAKNRLIAAGEYAVPALLRQLNEGQNEQLRLACHEMLVQIGREAVSPLCAALRDLTGNAQKSACDILGTIAHPHAAPYLQEVASSDSVDGPIREAASRAFSRVGGVPGSLSTLFSDLAGKYFDGQESLIAYVDEPTNNVWSYSTITGLSPTPVPTPIFNEIMAVRTASKAVSLDAGNTTAISLFVAANLKRENDLPAGAADPIYGANKYTPEFYATVFGTSTCQDVLSMAVDKLDTALVRDALAALAKTTGGANLFARDTRRQPLLEALIYPDRRVQYEAALTLGSALPSHGFAGDNSVVPILASAVRTGNTAPAIVIADHPENRTHEATRAREQQFAVIAAGASAAEVQPDIARSAAVDLVIVRMTDLEAARQTLAAIRSMPKTSATPVLLLCSLTDAARLSTEYRGDPRVKIARIGLTPEQYAANVEDLMLSASGGRMTEAEAEEYAIRALDVLRDIAISRCQAFNITDAEAALIDALDTRSGGTRMLVGEILALIGTDTSQRKLLDAALAARGDEQVELLGRVADSVRLHGNRAERRHVQAVVDLVANSEGSTAEAAATVHGALNLPTSDAVKLIPME